MRGLRYLVMVVVGLVAFPSAVAARTAGPLALHLEFRTLPNVWRVQAIGSYALLNNAPEVCRWLTISPGSQS